MLFRSSIGLVSYLESKAGIGVIIFIQQYDTSPIDASKLSSKAQLTLSLENEKYYFAIFSILKELYPNVNVDQLISEFKEEIKKPFIFRENNYDISKNNKYDFFKNLQSYKNWVLGGGLIVFSGVGILSFIFNSQKNPSSFQEKLIQVDESIRSEFFLPVDNFLLKRPELMVQISKKLEKQKGIQAVVLVGVGGSGKTTLAHQYAGTQQASVVWEINAETSETLSHAFENLAVAIAKTEEDKKLLKELQGIKNPLQRDERTIQFIKDRLKAKGSWVLIYDNVEKFSDIKKYFPQDSKLWGQGRVILTTQDINIQCNKIINDVIHVETLDRDQKYNLFTKIMYQEDTSSLSTIQVNDLKEFLEKLPPFPLDISLAAYYLKSTRVSYITYLEYINQNNEDFANMQESLLKEAGSYIKTRHKIIALSLQKLIKMHKDFADLLLYISLLDSQNISKELLVNFKNSNVVDNFIYNLKKFSLITNEGNTPTLGTYFSLHRSTQSIMSALLIRTLNMKKTQKSLQLITNSLEAYIMDIIESEDFFKMKYLVTHCERFLTHSHILPNFVEGCIGGKLGSIYYYQGLLIKAKEVIEKSLTLLNKEMNYPKFAYILIYLGNVYRSLGDYEKANKFLEQTVEIFKHYDQKHRGFPRALGFLGYYYREIGNYKAAERLLNQSLSIYKRRSLENSIPIAWVSTHLAITYREIGYYSKAKILLEESLIIYKKKSEDYVGVAWVLGHLGIVYKEMKDYKKAKDLIEQSLKIYRMYFSESHLYVIWAQSHLAQANINLGDYEQAQIQLKRIIEIYEKNYGKKHIETTRAIRELGRIYFLAGQFENSERLLNNALAIFKNNKHPEAYQTLECLAEVYLKKSTHATKGEIQQYKKRVRDYLQQALKIVVTHFPENVPHKIRIQEKLKSLNSS